MKAYDTRFDTAQTASLWPGILAEKPLVGFALGGPDTAALQQRLPNDKVVMLLASASNGFGWRPNQWVLSMRPTFVHEQVGFIDWYQKTKLGGKRPVKVALVTSEASPSYADIAKGITAYAKANPGVIELVEIVFAEVQPADLTLQMRRVTNAGAELILAPASLQQAIAVKRALQALGRKVPVAFSMHNSPGFIAKPMGGIEALEGDYEAQSGVIATNEDTEAKRFYDMLTAKYGLKAPWHGITAAGIAQTLLLVRSVEAAARKNGSTKLNGEMIHQTLLDTPITGASLFGYSSDLSYNISAPFPVYNPKVNVGVVKDGKVTSAVTGYPIPKLERW
jgi:branched-chain amino acid transport system substrate-binding protein